MNRARRTIRWVLLAALAWAAAAHALAASTAKAQTTAASGAVEAVTLYHNYCSVCHGEKGDGKSRASGSFSSPPRDFTSAASKRELSPERIAAVTTHGRPGTAMVAWKSQLSEVDINRLAQYIYSRFVLGGSEAAGARAAISGTMAHGGREADAVSTPARIDMTAGLPNGLKGDTKRGGAFYLANCATCHGARGDGAGPRAYFINPKPRNFLDEAWRARFNRLALYVAVSEGNVGTEMPAWARVATRQQLADVSEYVFQAFILGKTDMKKATAPR